MIGYRKVILEFIHETESWTVIGEMEKPKSGHAVSVVSFQDYENWCSAGPTTAVPTTTGPTTTGPTTTGPTTTDPDTNGPNTNGHRVLITGSSFGNGLTAEIFDPVTKNSCTLPQLPEPRESHTADGGLACGGGSSENTQNTCVKWTWTSGTWSLSHTLREPRYDHVSWATTSGVYLMGGTITGVNSKTSEKVKLDGSVEEGFSIKYDIR